MGTILNKMNQSVLLIKDNQATFFNENFKKMIGFNKKSFGLSASNTSLSIDNVIDIDFLKLYETNKEFFDRSYTSVLAGSK